MTELQQLAEQQARQIQDVTQQRDAQLARTERQEAELSALVQRLQQQEATAAVEREAHVQHLHAAEDRAHAEVDRARQDVKELRAQLAALLRERAASEQLLRQQRDDALVAAVAAQREADLQRGRAEAHAQQLAQLGDLPATLQATLAQARPPAGRRGSQRNAKRSTPR